MKERQHYSYTQWCEEISETLLAKETKHEYILMSPHRTNKIQSLFMLLQMFIIYQTVCIGESQNMLDWKKYWI